MENAGNIRWKRPREVPWAQNESSPGTVQLRVFTLRELWEIFVDDRPFGADALFRHVNVQSKTAFSYAMTLIDKIR